MIGVLLATHGDMSLGLKNAVELIMGSQEKFECLCLFHETSIDEFGDDIVKKVNELDSGKGVLIFTDMVSASPYNQAVLKNRNFSKIKNKIITGVNLPMLIEAFCLRTIEDDIENVWEKVINTGKESIKEFHNEFNKI